MYDHWQGHLTSSRCLWYSSWKYSDQRIYPSLVEEPRFPGNAVSSLTWTNCSPMTTSLSLLIVSKASGNGKAPSQKGGISFVYVKNLCNTEEAGYQCPFRDLYVPESLDFCPKISFRRDAGIGLPRNCHTRTYFYTSLSWLTCWCC